MCTRSSYIKNEYLVCYSDSTGDFYQILFNLKKPNYTYKITTVCYCIYCASKIQESNKNMLWMYLSFEEHIYTKSYLDSGILSGFRLISIEIMGTLDIGLIYTI